MTRKAFIIGCNQGNEYLCAESDAKKIAAALKVHDYIVDLHVGADETKEQILNALEIFIESNPEDIILFYFSGHGIVHKSQGFLKLNTSNDNFDSMLWIQSIESKLSVDKCKSTQRLILLDCCNAKDVIRVIMPRHTFIIGATAIAEESKAIPHIGGSLFTYNIVEGLMGRKWISHKITPLNLVRYLQSEQLDTDNIKLFELNYDTHIVHTSDLQIDFEIITDSYDLSKIIKHHTERQDDAKENLKPICKRLKEVENKIINLRKEQKELSKQKDNLNRNKTESANLINRYLKESVNNKLNLMTMEGNTEFSLIDIFKMENKNKK
jgi:uncharacterized caspase-like protein